MTTPDRDPYRFWRPDWAVPPGDLLQEWIEDHGVTVAHVAEQLDLPVWQVERFIRGERSLTVDWTRKIEKLTGIPESLWIGLEVMYRENLARQRRS